MLPYPPRVRSARRTSPPDRKKLRRNFFGSLFFETIFALGNGVRRPVTRLKSSRHRRASTQRPGIFSFRDGSQISSAHEKTLLSAGRRQTLPSGKSGAGEGARTLDPDLGKVVLYH